MNRGTESPSSATNCGMSALCVCLVRLAQMSSSRPSAYIDRDLSAEPADLPLFARHGLPEKKTSPNSLDLLSGGGPALGE